MHMARCLGMRPALVRGLIGRADGEAAAVGWV